MKRVLIILQALLCLLLIGGAGHAWAAEDKAAAQVERQKQQPLNNAPVWREVRSGESHFTTVRGVETGVLIQPGGETWRQLRNGPISLYGGLLLCAVVIGIGIFYMFRGPIKLNEPPSGRLMVRFTFIERVVHWSMAFSFVVLMISGLIMLFGKYVLLPLFGYTLFSWVAVFSKNLHNFVGPLFILSILVGIPMFLKDNLFRSYDWEWVKKLGGALGDHHAPSHRFNAGEKLMFWVMVVGLGLVLSISGLTLDFPNFAQGRYVMQVASVSHWVGSILAMCIGIGHIYIGTVGMEGALDSMRYGCVDEVWAREHHEYWYNDEKAAQAAEGRTVPSRPAVAQA